MISASCNYSCAVAPSRFRLPDRLQGYSRAETGSEVLGSVRVQRTSDADAVYIHITSTMGPLMESLEFFEIRLVGAILGRPPKCDCLCLIVT